MLVAIMATACQQKQTLPRQFNVSLEPHFDSVFLDVNGVTASDLHSLMVVQDGKVIYEKYGVGCRPDDLHIMWSATKTFTALAAGFAWQDSLLDLNARLIDYLDPEQLPDSMSAELQQVTIYHLLTMASGWEADMITNRIRGHEQFNTIQEILHHPFRDVPGHQWRYNNIDSYMLGVAIAQVTGMPMEDYLNQKLFTPLGIDDYYYQKDSEGYNTAAFGLYLTTESLAKVGMLMLQKGNGRVSDCSVKNGYLWLCSRTHGNSGRIQHKPQLIGSRGMGSKCGCVVRAVWFVWMDNGDSMPSLFPIRTPLWL